jgi:hypothetical protein
MSASKKDSSIKRITERYLKKAVENRLRVRRQFLGRKDVRFPSDDLRELTHEGIKAH